ncbi:cyanamide hydratase family HD domain-containing protein [Colletotrichum fioriniae PJ7]|uniref:Cyanamide hydratase family HD domain-containing protein n=1 Tax=Colletotrichum fioriniae PJ7 TaxID=1445577 RepID=A0A010SL86_9PEZI|nr:cyanamide hydratase family HD domain-containing protein [Colletotrichum fioriniae PJ7]
MSFDICGGFNALQALRALKEDDGSADQAEVVAEAIIRHWDMNADGAITYIGQPSHLVTLYNNLYRHPRISGLERMVHVNTRREIHEAWPRLGRFSWFAVTVKGDEGVRPRFHSTHIHDFNGGIESNTLTRSVSRGRGHQACSAKLEKISPKCLEQLPFEMTHDVAVGSDCPRTNFSLKKEAYVKSPIQGYLFTKVLVY